MVAVKQPRIGLDLIDYLRKNFPPKCIGPDETMAEAQRYAGKVELARKLIRMGKGDEDHDLPQDDED
ncbi:hypothetical protein [Mesorhizobium sp. B2-8-3]|uniref:hypothetical protein n=1 Tax=Mesorhizobium sp. B2-8-3 TaxID=2589905 RepID=UPI00112813F6|nr:hypothetical protein [Mesorhizobium sp. B2-8-3]TPJ33668.1 hypothetical protein FJ418_13645 [Mesorhizobium sp. B2-8-3]